MAEQTPDTTATAPAHTELWVERTGTRLYTGKSSRGAEVLIGSESVPGVFTPGELLKIALAACTGMSSDFPISRRLGDNYDATVRVSGAADRENEVYPQLDEVLELCDLKRVRHKIIGQLSKGYRQRVGIAEAILAEPPVAVVEGNAKTKGNLDVAEAYLKFLYTPEGQKLAAKNFFRPVDPSAAAPADLARFPKIELVSIDKDFGGWSKAQKEFFADGAIFDQIYRPTN